MKTQRMELTGLDRARYFIPTAICLYLSALCLLLIITSAFLVTLQNAVAVTASGVFGLLLSGALGLLIWHAQRRELQFLRIVTSSDAATNYAMVRAAAVAAGWRLLRDEPDRRIDAQTTAVLLDAGERVAVRFSDATVFVASICDPAVGFSLVGRRHCTEHRERVRQAILGRNH